MASGIDGPVVAVIGGGQLARMLAQAAIGLGVPLHLLAEEADGSAAQVVRDPMVGDYRNLDTLLRAAEGCAVVTFDHEQVPPEHIRALETEGHVCRPGSRALVYAQDKSAMRDRLNQLAVPSPRHAVVSDAGDVDDFVATVGGPAVLKSIRGGYDGKGVWTVASGADAAPVLAQTQAMGQNLLVEELVDIARELSALVVRSPSGQVAAYPVVQSVQRDGICVEVIAPAPRLDAGRAIEAQQLAMRIAGDLDVVGVLAVELFETRDGRLLVNELAMRPHNTGHWSIDGAVTSQFENHLRAVLDLPLGDPASRAPWTGMVNVLGGSVGSLYDGYRHVFARDPALRVHLYGKKVQTGRKVGHVTAYGDDLEDVLRRARHAASWFAGDEEEET